MIRDLDAEVLAISTDELSEAAYLVDSLGLEFPILYDPDATVVTDYGVFDLLKDGLATPSTFLIDKEGSIRWEHVGRDIDDRVSAQQVMNELAKLRQDS